MVVPVLTVFEKHSFGIQTSEHLNFHDFQAVEFYASLGNLQVQKCIAFVRNVRRSTKYLREIFTRRKKLCLDAILCKQIRFCTKVLGLIIFFLPSTSFVSCPPRILRTIRLNYIALANRNGARTIFPPFPPILLQLVATTRHNSQRRIRVSLAHGKLLSMVYALK